MTTYKRLCLPNYVSRSCRIVSAAFFMKLDALTKSKGVTKEEETPQICLDGENDGGGKRSRWKGEKENKERVSRNKEQRVKKWKLSKKERLIKKGYK